MPSTPGFLRSWAQAVGGTDDATVVFGSAYPDIGALLRDVLPANLKGEDDAAPLDIGWGGPPWAVNVYGPLGLTVFSATSEDLGLAEEEVRALLGGAGRDLVRQPPGPLLTVRLGPWPRWGLGMSATDLWVQW